MQEQLIETKITFRSFGDMMVASEWIAGKTERKKYLKWMKSSGNYQALRQAFSDEDILKYLDYIETLKTFYIKSVNTGNPKIWIVDKFLHVETLKSSNEGKNPVDRFKFVVMSKPLQKNNASFVKNIGKILETIKTHTSFGEYLVAVMNNPENNNVYSSTMKSRLLLDGVLLSEIEDDINPSNFNIYEFVESYSSDPIIIKWAQHCALVCIAKDLTN
jgi:hypothetical protein